MFSVTTDKGHQEQTCTSARTQGWTHAPQLNIQPTATGETNGILTVMNADYATLVSHLAMRWRPNHWSDSDANALTSATRSLVSNHSLLLGGLWLIGCSSHVDREWSTRWLPRALTTLLVTTCWLHRLPRECPMYLSWGSLWPSAILRFLLPFSLHFTRESSIIPSVSLKSATILPMM